MKKIKKFLASPRFLCAGVLLSLFIGVASPSLYVSAAPADNALLSPALLIIADDSSMAMAGLAGSSISFEKNDFLRALNLSAVDSIVITQAPPSSEGELRVGNTVLSKGQTVSASSLSLLSFVPSDNVAGQSSFRFSADNSGYDIACELYMLERANSCPTLSYASEVSLNASTHRNVALYGNLSCYDPDGDEVFVEIVSYPESGVLTLLDKYSGDYVYVPDKNFSGKDSFCYVARDKYGNYSAASEVKLEVNKLKTTVSFDDMQFSAYYNAALTMVEEGIMSGTQVGSDTYFYPEREVSRGEFVVMLMHALGIKDVSESASTPFADNDAIPVQMRGFVAAAYSLGYVKGSVTEDGLCFEANKNISRAEAAVIIGNVLNVATPTVIPTFSDSADIPAWAASSVYSLSAIGVIERIDGGISPMNAVTRADAAQMLVNLMHYIDQ